MTTPNITESKLLPQNDTQQTDKKYLSSFAILERDSSFPE